MRHCTSRICLTVAATLTVPLFASAQEMPPEKRHHFSLGGRGPHYVEDRFSAAEIDLSAAQSDGRYTWLDETWQPGFSVSPHFHRTHAEVFYVLDGQVEWTVNGETHVMSRGDMVFIPANTVHAVKVLGERPYRGLMIYAPGGYEDNLERSTRYSEEQKADPEIQASLRAASDFNPVPSGREREAFSTRVLTSLRPAKHHFSLNGTGKTYVQDEWVTSEVDLSALQSEGLFELLDERWKPGFTVPPHYHARHAETFFVVSGQVEWTVGGETHLMGPGDLVFIPPNTAHSVRVVGNETVHNLMFYDPPDYEDHMVRQSGYTRAQQEEPGIKAELRRLSDFNLVVKKPG